MPDRSALTAVAARQHAVFTTRQVLHCGFSYKVLRCWQAAATVVERHPGVFAFAGAPQTWEQSLMAAVLAAGEGAAVSHRSAARLWGFLDGDDTVEITVPRSRRPRLDGVVVHRSRDLADNHVSWLNRFPVTKPARVIVDLGAVLEPADVEDVLDRALTRKRTTIAGVEWMLTELSQHGRRGTGVVGKILDERALGKAPAHGQLEPRMARLLRRAGLPSAVFQHRISTPEGRFLAQVDFAYPELLLAIEVDGWECHGSPSAMGKDFVRQNGLVPFRWRVLRFTWAQVVNQPEYVAAMIGRTLVALAA
ncbi:MAG: DUF559 domain-containing protein [Acidimicrobiia bacterium]